MSKRDSSQHSNAIGKNINHLRLIHGETLEELGNAVYLGNTTIKNYESGNRLPDLYTLATIASHYGKTVDELLNSDLTELDKITLPTGNLDAWVTLIETIQPLAYSETAMKNNNFRKGYNRCRDILECFAKNEPVSGAYINECIDWFSGAYENDGLSEAAANLIWISFLFWSNIMDQDMRESLTAISCPREGQPAANKIFLNSRCNVSQEIQQKRKEFICDNDDDIMELIKTLKADPEWADLGDYYLGLKYIVGMVDTGLSQEVNQAVGMQMLLSQARLDNRFALKALRLMLSA